MSSSKRAIHRYFKTERSCGKSVIVHLVELEGCCVLRIAWTRSYGEYAERYKQQLIFSGACNITSWIFTSHLMNLGKKFSDSHHMRRYLVLCKTWLQIFIKSRRLETNGVKKMVFTTVFVVVVVVVVVVCKHDNLWKNYRNGLKFGTPLEGQKERTSLLTSYF